MSQPDLLKAYGLAGRMRAMKLFGWNSVAEATVELYRCVLE